MQTVAAFVGSILNTFGGWSLKHARFSLSSSLNCPNQDQERNSMCWRGTKMEIVRCIQDTLQSTLGESILLVLEPRWNHAFFSFLPLITISCCFLICYQLTAPWHIYIGFVQRSSTISLAFVASTLPNVTFKT